MKHNPASHRASARHHRNRSSFAALAALFLVGAGSILPLNAKSHTAPSPDKLSGLGLQPVEYFYTGKLYDTDSETYTFKYRNYDPELNRWTTADPSGFPDGANNQIYVHSPLFQFDPLGLETQWITGTYVMEASWKEVEHFDPLGNPSFSINFPWSVSITISPGFYWEKEGYISVSQISEAQPTETTPPEGWQWVPETITITGWQSESNPRYLTFSDFPEQNGETWRWGYLQTTYEWKRQAEE